MTLAISMTVSLIHQPEAFDLPDNRIVIQSHPNVASPGINLSETNAGRRLRLVAV